MAEKHKPCEIYKKKKKKKESEMCKLEKSVYKLAKDGFATTRKKKTTKKTVHGVETD